MNAVSTIAKDRETDFKVQVRGNWIAAQYETLNLQGYYLSKHNTIYRLFDNQIAANSFPEAEDII